MTRIDFLRKVNYLKYNKFLLENKHTLLYHSFQYKELLENFLESNSRYLLAIDQDDNILGAFPLMISKSGQFGPVINSLPFYGSNGGVIVSPKISAELQSEIKTALLKRSLDLVQNLNCAAMVIITNPFEDDITFYKEKFPYHFTDKRIGQITKLPDHEEDFESNLMQIFQRPRPQNIRKAIKSGVEHYSSNTIDALKLVHDLHRKNILAIGGLPKEFRFFKMILEHFNETEFKVYIAHLNGNPIAAVLLFYYNQVIEYFTPAIDEDKRNYQPLALLIFEAMKDGIKCGYRYWNWGGTWLSQKGVYDFKKRWGTVDYAYHYFIYVNNRKLLESSKNSLLRDYPNYYVLPFDQLKRQKK